MIVYLRHHYHRHRLQPTEEGRGRRAISIEARMHEIWLENDLSGRLSSIAVGRGGDIVLPFSRHH